MIAPFGNHEDTEFQYAISKFLADMNQILHIAQHCLRQLQRQKSSKLQTNASIGKTDLRTLTLILAFSFLFRIRSTVIFTHEIT